MKDGFKTIIMNNKAALSLKMRLVPDPKPGAQCIQTCNKLLGVGLCLCLIFVTAGPMTAAAAVFPLQGKSVPSQISKLDRYLAEDTFFQAIKKADLSEYNRFRSLMIRALQSGKTQQEIDLISGQFGSEFLQARLRRASPKTIRQYMSLRTKFMEQMTAISPSVLYSLVVSGQVDTAGISEKNRTKIAAVTEQLSDQMASIVTAPSLSTPLPVNNLLVKKNITDIRKRLSAGELAELDKAGTSEVNPALFCDAYIKFYRECLKLPDVQMVQVSRFVGLIPEDDRTKRQ
jgi:hypothetical protein